jgi:hypothetical protein
VGIGNFHIHGVFESRITEASNDGGGFAIVLDPADGAIASRDGDDRVAGGLLIGETGGIRADVDFGDPGDFTGVGGRFRG